MSFEESMAPRIGDDLLAIGVARHLSGAAYAAPDGAYARILYHLAAPEVPVVWPYAFLAGGESATGARQPNPGGCFRPGPIVLVDIESLGFIGRPLFLIGALYLPSGGTAAAAPAGELVQYLARDYSEEESVMRAFLREAAQARTWVTFNGRTFDVPFLELRAAYYGLPRPRPLQHVDLLAVARRRWGPGLPDCRLQTLESHLCGRPRAADIDGAQIPAVYHEFVRSGEPWGMMQILRHNAADLVSLLDLLHRALDPRECGEP